MKLQTALLFLIAIFSTISYGNDKIWISVDTKALTLSVQRGSDTLRVFKNIAVGRKGSGFKQQRGDDITPIGRYKIGWIGKKTIYHRFFGITYPSPRNAQTAYKKGLITHQEYLSINQAHRTEKVPPQNTSLGGLLGIHGLGNADKNIHKLFNWTHGCIALSNEQIDQLAPWIERGTEIIIK